MGGKLKFLFGGILFGLLLLFAYTGFKSIFINNTPAKPNQWEMEPATSSYSANTPMIGATTGANLTKPQAETPPDETPKPNTAQTAELVNEPNDPNGPNPMGQDNNGEENPANSAQVLNPDGSTPTPNPAQNPSQAAQQTTTNPAANLSGKLEIVSQTSENGQALKANVYVQQINGVAVDKATYMSKASFTLKPGTYKVTVRAEGRASVTRNIIVPASAVVNEIFPLPRITDNKPLQNDFPPEIIPSPPATTPQFAPPPPNRPTTVVRPPQENAPMGRLRVVALSADDGSPLQVDFTISRLDGGILDQANNVTMTDFALPAQEVVVNFNYRGFKGYKSLTVYPGQTTTHTFNIRGVRN